MHLETAIRDAVEKGGFKNEVIEGIKNFHGRTEAYTFGRLNTSAILLDPAFWRALGKARGWNALSTHEHGSDEPCNGFCIQDLKGGGWQSHWHRFIDHLIAGGDAETFFASLT